MGERLNAAATKTKEHARKITALAAIGATVLLAAGCGDDEGIHSKKAADAVAVKDYDLTWEKSSPAGKFELQYLSQARMDILDKNGGDNSNDGNTYHSFVFNNGCLQNTAYDIGGGRINGSFSFSGGLLGGGGSGEINGRVPTAAANAYVDARTPDILTVQSGRASSHTLRFSGLQSKPDPRHPHQIEHLTPLDQQTWNVVSATNDCMTPGEVAYHHTEKYAGSTSDFLVRTSDDIRPKASDGY